jgi:putative CocE/NonD family hydrolase
MQITGHPVVDLYLSADATDATVFVYLEDIAPNGKVTYITEGMLKASHRKISADTPPYPVAAEYRSFKKSDMQPLVPNEATRLCFDMLPISYLLQKGHRLRVSIASSDDDHFEVIPENIRPKNFQIHHSSQYPSQVKIPVLK